MKYYSFFESQQGESGLYALYPQIVWSLLINGVHLSNESINAIANDAVAMADAMTVPPGNMTELPSRQQGWYDEKVKMFFYRTHSGNLIGLRKWTENESIIVAVSEDSQINHWLSSEKEAIEPPWDDFPLQYIEELQWKEN